MFIFAVLQDEQRSSGGRKIMFLFGDPDYGYVELNLQLSVYRKLYSNEIIRKKCKLQRKLFF